MALIKARVFAGDSYPEPSYFLELKISPSSAGVSTLTSAGHGTPGQARQQLEQVLADVFHAGDSIRIEGGTFNSLPQAIAEARRLWP